MTGLMFCEREDEGHVFKVCVSIIMIMCIDALPAENCW